MPATTAVSGLAGRFGPNVHFVSVDAGNVGAARAAGFEYARSAVRRRRAARTWFATTDADSMVGSRVAIADDRRRRRHGARRGADIRCGGYPVEVARRYLARLQLERTGPRPHPRRQHGIPGGRLLAASAASVRWPPVRTSTSSNDSRPRTCASTVTPSFRWRPRPVEEGPCARWIRRTISADCRVGAQTQGGAET